MAVVVNYRAPFGPNNELNLVIVAVDVGTALRKDGRLDCLHNVVSPSKILNIIQETARGEILTLKWRDRELCRSSGPRSKKERIEYRIEIQIGGGFAKRTDGTLATVKIAFIPLVGD